MPTTTHTPAYTPDTWTADQRRTHTPSTLDEAFYWASCLAGGYYHRPVTIDSTIVGREELYRLRPHDAPPADGYWPVYTVTAH
jgi:hypothetical protein